MPSDISRLRWKRVLSLSMAKRYQNGTRGSQLLKLKCLKARPQRCAPQKPWADSTRQFEQILKGLESSSPALSPSDYAGKP